MRQYGSTAQTALCASANTDVAGNDQDVIRGLVHGVILALPVWVVAGYLTVLLR